MKFKSIHIFKIWQGLWLCVWNLTEYLNISLGNLAPWVFSQITGTHYRSKEDTNERTG